MSICPKCKKEYDEAPALSRIDNKTLICPECGTKESLDAAGLCEGSAVRESILKEMYDSRGKKTPADRTRDSVVASGNKWAIKNYNATHN